MNNLKVATVQSSLVWENPKANFDHFENLLSSVEDVDLIVLPEMFNTGFSMESSRLSETMDGSSVNWLKSVASQKNCVVTGSVIIEEEGNYYNRLVWVNPSGDIFHYNKRHLFRMANEHEFFSPGKERLVVELKGWKICPMICYDLRFPVWSRNDINFDLLMYVANWPAPRTDAWSSLLKARAIENQCYCIGVNRIGEDEAGRSYSGATGIYDPKGQLLNELKIDEECVQIAELSYLDLADFRAKFPVHLDRDKFEIKV